MNALVNTDPLDSAYLAIGAARMLDKLLPATRAATDMGELDLVQLAMDAAPALQKAWKEVCHDWEGVWAYDVCEPVGAQVVFEWLGNSFKGEPDEYDRIVRTIVAQAVQA